MHTEVPLLSGGKAIAVDLKAKLTAFFHGTPILVERKTDKLVMQTWVFGTWFLKNE